jgi:hypothetical protein
MCIVTYSCDTVIMFCTLSVKLMYLHFNKPYVLMLHAVLFSLFQFASTVVTYMIVLVQYVQSDKSQNVCGRNVTDWVTWRVELCVMWLRKPYNLFSLSSMLLLLLLLLLPTRTSLLSKYQHAVSDRSFSLNDRLYMWQNRSFGGNLQIWIFWPIVWRQWAVW